MPRRSTTKRTPNRRRPYRRRFYRKRRRNNSSNVIVRGPYICPDAYYCKLVYNDTLNVNPALPYYDYLWHGNSVYDPDYTSAGAQPLGFDQLTALYQRFTVMGVKISATVLPTQSLLPDQQLTILANHSTTSYVDADLISQQPYAKTRFIGNSSTGPVTLSAYYSTSKIMGCSKKKIMDDDVFSGSYNSNPSQKFYIHTFLADLAGGDTRATIKVKLTYYVKFWDRFPLAAS